MALRYDVNDAAPGSPPVGPTRPRGFGSGRSAAYDASAAYGAYGTYGA